MSQRAQLMYRQSRNTAVMTLKIVTLTPGGYTWWHSLPKTGKHSQRKLTTKLTRLLLSNLFPPLLLKAMLKACLSTDGTPNTQGSLLYNWLIDHVYKGDAVQLHKDWSQLPF